MTTTATINVDAIPLALRERPQWVLWRLEPRAAGEEPTKMPYRPSGTARAKAGVPSTWGAFDDVLRRFERGGFVGIGFEFADDDEFCGIDLDGCRDPGSGTIELWAREIIEAAATYAEVSPSGSGVKLFLRGKSPFDKGRKKIVPDARRIGDKAPAVELYDHARFFAVTGEALNGHNEVRPAQETIDRICERYLKNPPVAPATPLQPAARNGSHTGGADIEARCQAYLVKLSDSIIRNDGSGAMFRACCEIWRFTGDGATAWRLANWFNEMKCSPPWSEGELRHKFDDAQRAVEADGKIGFRQHEERDAPAKKARRKAGAKPKRAAAAKQATMTQQGTNGAAPLAGDQLRQLVKAAADAGYDGSVAAPVAEPGAPAGPADQSGGAVGLNNLFADEGRTDAALAYRFVTEHVQRLRYCGPWDKFLTWDGKRWCTDSACRAQGMMLETADSLWRKIDDLMANYDGEDAESLEATLRKFARVANSAKGVRDALSLARSAAEISVAPEAFDTDPWLLNVANGTLDLRNGQLRPHDRRDYLTKLSPIHFDPTAPAPTWERYLQEVFTGDPRMIGFVQRAAGYSLTAITRERCLLFLHGVGKNGKTTFVATLEKAWGDYAGTLTTDMLMSTVGERHPTEVCDLHGKRLVVANETESGRRFAESLIKSLTGGEDRLKGRRMREDFWEFDATHKLWITGNHRPRIKGTDDGIWDRIRLIPFKVRFTKPDKTLASKLAMELPGILAWCVCGCLDWQQHGLGEPDEVIEATAAYRSESDIVGRFIFECCAVDSWRRVSSAAVYQAYRDWGGEMGKVEFGTELGSRGYQSDRYTCGPQKGRMLWRGIGLVSEEDGNE